MPGDSREVAAHREAERVLSALPTPSARGELVTPGPAPPAARAAEGEDAPLSEEERAFFEPRFHRDFSRVRLHTGTRAAEATAAFGARALTVGSDVMLAPGEHRPESAEGRKILAHELAHVVQQSGGGPGLDAVPAPAVQGYCDPSQQSCPEGTENPWLDETASTGPEEQCSLSPEESIGEEAADEGVDLNGLLAQVRQVRDRLERPMSYGSRAMDEALLVLYEAELAGRIRLFDEGLMAALPEVQTQIDAELATSNNMSRQIHVASMRVEGGGGDAYTLRILYARLRIRNVHYAIFPMESVTYEEVMIGGIYPDGTTQSPEEYRSRSGVVESEGLGPIEWLFVGRALFGGLRALGGLLLRRLAVRLSLRTAVRSLRARLFARPTVTGNPLMAAGEGATDRFGNIVYSTAGTLTDQQLALSHETVHSILSPRLLPLRSLRADIRMWAYRRSAFMQYLEEALAESYAQLRVVGIRGLPTGIRFPIANGYVTLSAVLTEAAIGTIVVGGTTYAVYVVADEAATEGEGATEGATEGTTEGEGATDSP